MPTLPLALPSAKYEGPTAFVVAVPGSSFAGKVFEAVVDDKGTPKCFLVTRDNVVMAYAFPVDRDANSKMSEFVKCQGPARTLTDAEQTELFSHPSMRQRVTETVGPKLAAQIYSVLDQANTQPPIEL